MEAILLQAHQQPSSPWLAEATQPVLLSPHLPLPPNSTLCCLLNLPTFISGGLIGTVSAWNLLPSVSRAIVSVGTSASLNLLLGMDALVCKLEEVCLSFLYLFLCLGQSVHQSFLPLLPSSHLGPSEGAAFSLFKTGLLV